jgi:hypothetical protein
MPSVKSVWKNKTDVEKRKEIDGKGKVFVWYVVVC